jgi:bifunctional DNA-binding transcriptional regulator/antitoxin component of YhaV-PrlF toxin-antitoxin module
VTVTVRVVIPKPLREELHLEPGGALEMKSAGDWTMICSKRLEKGRFSWPSRGDENGKLRLSQEKLAILLGGIELKQSRRKD